MICKSVSKPYTKVWNPGHIPLVKPKQEIAFFKQNTFQPNTSFLYFPSSASHSLQFFLKKNRDSTPFKKQTRL